MARTASDIDHAYVTRDVATIAIVEDEPDIAQVTARKIQSIVSDTLLQTVICYDYLSALALLTEGNVDIFIVDIRIPERIGKPERSENGKLLIETITQSTNSAVIVFSGETNRIDHEEFYRLGAVGVIDKVAGQDELAANINSVLRLLQKNRTATKNGEYHIGTVHKFGVWQFVSGERKLFDATGSTQDIDLTQMEDTFLATILVNKDKQINRDDIYSLVLRRIPNSDDRGHSSLVAGLRKKLPPEIKLQSNNKGIYQLMPFVAD